MSIPAFGVIDKEDWPQLTDLRKRGGPVFWQYEFQDRSSTSSGDIWATTNYNVRPGKSNYLPAIVISADGPCKISWVLRQGTKTSGLLGVYNQSSVIFGEKGGIYSIPFNQLIPEATDIIFTISASVTGNKCWVSLCMPGAFEFTGRFNYKSRFRQVVCSDSIGHSSMGSDANGVAYPGKCLWGLRMEEALRRDGLDITTDILGFGGSTSAQWAEQIDNCYLDSIKYDVMYVSIGTNDSNNQTVSIANFKANLIKFINHRDTYRPDAIIIYMAPFNTDIATRTPYIANYRNAMQEVANHAELGGIGRRVYYIDMSEAFSLNPNATQDINILVSERITGLRLHLSGLGHQKAFEHLYPYFKTLPFWEQNKI